MALTLGNNVAEQRRPYRGAAELRQCIALLFGHAVTRQASVRPTFFVKQEPLSVSRLAPIGTYCRLFSHAVAAAGSPRREGLVNQVSRDRVSGQAPRIARCLTAPGQTVPKA